MIATVLLDPFRCAVAVRTTMLLTAFVLIVKSTLVAPAGIVTVKGTMITELAESTLTVTPPVGAGEEMVTVPVVGVPPFTVLGFAVNDTILMVGLIVIETILDTPL